mgnify:CR=1 FL=1
MKVQENYMLGEQSIVADYKTRATSKGSNKANRKKSLEKENLQPPSRNSNYDQSFGAVGKVTPAWMKEIESKIEKQQQN